MIFDSSASVIASHQTEFTQYFTHPGWQEQDPHEIIDKINENIREAVKSLEAGPGGYKASDIKVIGVTNQRETTVVWDKDTGKALTRCIAWPDNRNGHTIAKLAGKSEKGIDAVKK